MWALRRIRDTPSCALKLQICPRQRSVHVATQRGPKGSGGSHQNGGSQSKFSQDYIAAEGIFLARGLFTTLQETQTPSRRDILAEANDWTVAADLEGLRHYPQLLRDSGRRPDVVLASSSSDAFILIELTVPWVDRIEASNVLKTEKYSGLAKDLEDSGFRVKLMPVEVGVRGLVWKSAYTFLTQIGLSSRERTKAMTKMSEAAEAASCWIWEMRGRKRC